MFPDFVKFTLLKDSESNASDSTSIQNRCCVCGEIATHKHISVMGFRIYRLCENHYKNTSPSYGYCQRVQFNRMGLIDSDGNFVDLVYL